MEESRRQLFLREKLRLYVVTDERDDKDSLLAIIRQAVAGGATSVQLRRKGDDGRAFVELGRAIRKATAEMGALFFVNDRIDIALLTDADGVHIGQSDISCVDARKLMGNKFIGVSASTLDEAVQAAKDGADYLGVGAIYATPSKTDADLCGLEGLAEIAKTVTLPIVSIGGLNAGNVFQAIQAGSDGAAVISCVMNAPSPRDACVELLRAMSQ